jgi:hypothetical protein
MTKKEFASQIRLRDKHVTRIIFIWMTVIGLWMIGGALLDNVLNWGGSDVFRQSYGIFGVVIIIAFFLALVVLQRGMPCQHCRKRLFGVSAQIAVATGTCGYCGEKAFE